MLGLTVERKIIAPTVNLYVFSCLHWLDAQTDVALIKSQIRKVKEDPAGLWIGLGDWMDNTMPYSFANPGQRLNPDEQRWGRHGAKNSPDVPGLLDLFRPIALKGVAMISGNHEQRTVKHSLTDLLQPLAASLSVPYQPFQMAVALRLGRLTYRIALYHGSGGGTTIGAATNRLSKFASSYPDAHLCLMAHYHKGAILQAPSVWLWRQNSNRGGLYMHRRTMALCGAAYQWADGYGEQKALEPYATSQTVFHLANGLNGRDEHEIQATVYEGRETVKTKRAEDFYPKEEAWT